jgi:hypothetical protein
MTSYLLRRERDIFGIQEASNRQQMGQQIYQSRII